MSIRHMYGLVFLLIAGLACPLAQPDASGGPGIFSVPLTDEERAWIKAHPVIRVSNEWEYPPLDFFENGQPAGFSIDYLNMVARRVGLRLEYVQGTWDNLVAMGRNKEIDLLHTIFSAPEREAYFLFTTSYKSVINGIYVREGVTGVESVYDLAGKRVVLVKGDLFGEALVRLVPDAKYVLVDTYGGIVKAMALGQGDAAVMDSAVANYLIRKFMLTTILPAGEARLSIGQGDARYRLAVRNDWPLLHAILQKGMDTVTRGDMARLEFRWFGLARPPVHVGISLTEKEKAFLETHPRIRVHNEKDWSPFNYHEHGSPRGLSVDYMNLVASRLGVTVSYVTGPTWDDALGMIKNGELDVMLNIVMTDHRRTFLLFTEPYARAPSVIVSLDRKAYAHLAELAGRTVAFPQGYFYDEVLAASFPKVRRLQLPDTLACLKALSMGRVDAVLSEEVVVNSLIHRHILSDVRITGEADLGHPDYSNLRLGIRDDLPLLHSAILKAMADISPQEMRRIREKWLLPHRSPEGARRAAPRGAVRFFVYGGGALALLALIVWGGVRAVGNGRVWPVFGSLTFHRAVVAGLGVFVLGVGFAAWLGLAENKRQHLQDVERHLTGALSIFEDRLDLWLSDKVVSLRRMGRDPILSSLTRELYAVSPDKNGLPAPEAFLNALHDLRAYFEARRVLFEHIDFYIINTDHTVIGAMGDADIGTRHLLARQEPALLARAFGGEVLFAPRVAPEAPARSGDSEIRPAMSFIGPIRGEDGRILAVMALQVAPTDEFKQATRMLGELQSGETYAFDKRGRMLSPSRFEDQLRSIGLLGKDRESALNIEIRDPGVDLTRGGRPSRVRAEQPLTQMVMRAVQLRTEMKLAGALQSHSQMVTDTHGYRDYRGVPVFGAWRWNMDLDFGIAAEVDVREAMGHYDHTRLMVASLLGGGLGLAVFAVLLVLALGERSVRALSRAGANLEREVGELKKEVNGLRAQAGQPEKSPPP